MNDEINSFVTEFQIFFLACCFNFAYDGLCSQIFKNLAELIVF